MGNFGKVGDGDEDCGKGKPVQACTDSLKNIKTRLMIWKYKIIKVGGISIYWKYCMVLLYIKICA